MASDDHADMTCALRITAFDPDYPLNGRYVMDFDVGAYDPDAGPVPTTTDIAKAKHFDNAGEAIAFWRTQSRIQPIRWDGEPNRPLTGFSVEIVNVP